LRHATHGATASAPAQHAPSIAVAAPFFRSGRRSCLALAAIALFVLVVPLRS